jgi:hypothetical protein
MEFTDALSFAAAAPFITAVIAFLRSFVTVPSRVVPPLALALAVAWGVTLSATGHYDADPAAFVVVAFTVALAASGLHSVTATYREAAS